MGNLILTSVAIRYLQIMY